MPDKTFLREKILGKSRKISSGLRRVKSRRILKKLSREPVFRSSEHVAFYCGIAPEVETRTFLIRILKRKKIYLPRIDPRKKLSLCRVRSFARDLEKGAYGILEPRGFCKKRTADRMDLIVVPGVAFDPNGGRLGRGGGYYDRLLRKAGKVFKVGLCFKEQLVDKVSMKTHDVRMDKVITD